MISPAENRGFAAQVMKLATGTAVAQLAPLAAMPALTRLYSPATFGEYGVFSALLLGLSIVASGRYEIAIPLPTSRKTAFELLAASLIVAAAVTAATLAAGAAVLLVSGSGGPGWLQLGTGAVVLLPVGILFSALLQSCSYWLTREGRFGVVARARSTHGLVTALVGLGLGLLHVRSGLLLSLALGYVVAGVAVALAVLRSDGRRIRELSGRGIRAVLKEYRHFPLLNGGNAVLDLVRDSGTLIIFGALFGQAATGFLSQALRILRAPVSLVGQSVAQVYFPAVSRAQGEGSSIRGITARTMRSLLLVSVPLYLGVLAFGPWLFGTLFGSEWAVAGTYARILSPWFVLVLVVSSLSLLPVACDRQKAALGLNVLETSARLAAVALGGAVAGATGALVGVAAGGLATGGVQLGWYWRLSGRGAPRPPAGEHDRLRVLVITHLYPHPSVSHAGIFVQEQLEALSEHADVTLVVGRYGLDAQPSALREESCLRVMEVRLPWCRLLPSALRTAAVVPAYRRAALRIARTEGPFDVVHAHYGFPDGVAAVMLGRALRVPVVVTLHGSDFSRQIARPVTGRLIGRQLAQADCIIGVSNEIADGMRTAFALPAERVVHLPNGYNDAHIAVHAVRTPRYFLFVGSLIPRKNPDLLLEAYARIVSQTPLDLVIVGDGPMMQALRIQADQLGISTRVRFEGQVAHERIDGYLGDAVALVLPSSREGMPIIVNEALASGTPVVATRLEGVSQQVTSDVLGSLVPVGDVAGLAEAMLDVARRPRDYAAVARESGVVSWEQYGGMLLDVYRAVIRSRNAE